MKGRVFLIGAGLVIITIWVLQKYLPAIEPSDEPRQHNVRWMADLKKLGTNWPLIGCWVVTFGACVMGRRSTSELLPRS